MKQLFEILEDILEEDKVDVDFELNEENWDSLNIISFIAEVNSSLNVVVNAEKLGEAKLVKDLVNLIEQSR